MKRPPEPSEPRLIHCIKETGDCRSFAIWVDNYDPSVIGVIRESEGRAIEGWSFRRDRNRFVVSYQGADVSDNVVRFADDKVLLLETSMLPGAALHTEEIMQTAADFEQRVAVAVYWTDAVHEAHGKELADFHEGLVKQFEAKDDALRALLTRRKITEAEYKSKRKQLFEQFWT